MYTFETQLSISDWQRSGQRFNDESGAINAACQWVMACLENGLTVAVRLVKVEE